MRTTSTSFISGTGLKKCSPMNRSGRFTAVKSSVTEIEEVFEAKIASFFTMPSSDAYIFFFSSDIFNDGLDDDVAIGQVGFVRRPLETRADRVFLLRRDPALLHRTLGKLRQRFLDPGKTFVEILLLRLRARSHRIQP